MESEACCSNQTSLFSVIAECPALLEQVGTHILYEKFLFFVFFIFFLIDPSKTM